MAPSPAAAGFPWLVAGLIALGLAILTLLRVGWPNFLLVFFSRLRRSALDGHPVRASLLEIVAAQPGIHEAALARLVERDPKTVAYHMRVLHAANLVRPERLGGTTNWWPAEAEGSATLPARPPSALRTYTAQAVLRLIRAQPGVTYRELVRLAKIPDGTVHYHLRRLEEAGLVTTCKAGNRVHIFGKAEPQ